MVAVCFMVAGMSSRYGGIKQLAIVGPEGETLIEYSVNQAIRNNFSSIIFITNSRTEFMFREIFGEEYKGIPVKYIKQRYEEYRERPWGTADAVSLIDIEEPVIIVNGDDIYGESIYFDAYTLLHIMDYNLVGVCRLKDTLPGSGKVNRGIIEIEGDYEVRGMYEKLGLEVEDEEYHNKYANVNFMTFQPDFIREIRRKTEIFKREHEGDKRVECLLPDILNEMIQEGYTLNSIEIHNKVLGLTNPEDLDLLKEKLKHQYNCRCSS